MNRKSLTKFQKITIISLGVFEIALLFLNVAFGEFVSWWSFGFSFGSYFSFVLLSSGPFSVLDLDSVSLSSDQEVTGDD